MMTRCKPTFWGNVLVIAAQIPRGIERPMTETGMRNPFQGLHKQKSYRDVYKNWPKNYKPELLIAFKNSFVLHIDNKN